MQNFENPVSIDTPNILFQKEIERIKDIIGDPTVQSYAQVRDYLILLGIKIENIPSSSEIQERISKREALIGELRQAGYPNSLGNVPIRQLEKLKKIPNGSDVVKNRDKLEAELEKQQAPVEQTIKEATDIEGPLGRVRNSALGKRYEKIFNEIREYHRATGQHNFMYQFPPFFRRNQPAQPQQPKKSSKERKAERKTLGLDKKFVRFSESSDYELNKDLVAMRLSYLEHASVFEKDKKMMADLTKKEDALKKSLDELSKGSPKYEKMESDLKIIKKQKDETALKLSAKELQYQPYLKKIENDKNVKNALIIKQMFEEGIDPESKIAYRQVEKKVKKQLRDEEKMIRKMERKSLRIGPFTRGFFARRRIGKINQMKEKAIQLGYSDPTQLMHSGYLNKKVLERIEHKQKLIEEAKRYGLSPSNTTAHELNVERRVHQLGLHRVNNLPVVGPAIVGGFRRFWSVGNRTIGTNQTLNQIDPLHGGVQRLAPRRIAGFILKTRQRLGMTSKVASETGKVGKGIFKGIMEVKTQLEKGIPEKKEGK